MKGRIAVSMVALVAIALLVGCAKMSKAKTLATKTPKVGPLAKILVYVGEVPLGESGRSADATEINVGGAVVFTAQGRDAEGKPIPVNPTWTPSKPGIVEIMPTVGSKVTVKCLKEGDLDIIVEHAGVKKNVRVFCYE